MAYYPVLNSSDTSDIQSVMGFANRASGELFMPVMLLVTFMIWTLGSVFVGKPIHRALLYSSFICSIISILFVLMNWLNTQYMYFCFLMLAVSLIWTRLSEAYS